MTRIKARHNMSLHLGREGENLAYEVVFDISDWQEKYGLGTVSLIAQRPCDEGPYPCIITVDGSIVTWKITSADTAWHGDNGKCELQYRVGDVVVKSETWRTYVACAMDEPSKDAPEAYKGWVDQVLEAGEMAQTAASLSVASASEARNAVSNALTAVSEAQNAASNASAAVSEVQDAARNAFESASKAESAAKQTEELAESFPPKVTSADKGKVLIVGADGKPIWTAVKNVMEVLV